MIVAVDPRFLPPSLLNARLKMARAKHHLECMDRTLTDFLKDDPYKVSAEDEIEAREYVIRIQFNGMPSEIGLILGDAISCLRAALDHAAWQLASLTSRDVSSKVSFPIIGINNNDGRKQFKRSTVGMPAEAIAIIESLQPYHSRQAYASTRLWQLHRLWNIDKHRRVPFTVTKAEVRILHPPSAPPTKRWTNDGMVEYRFPLAAKTYVTFHSMNHVDIQFGDRNEGVAVSIKDLRDIYEFVSSDVVPRFKRFF